MSLESDQSLVKAKRKRRSLPKAKSIYTLPSPARRSLAKSLVKSKAVRPSSPARESNASSEDDQPSNEDDGDEQLTRSSRLHDDKKRVHHERSLRGWKTRRARTAILKHHLESHPIVESPSRALPDDDLLLALHHHASTFYTSHGLLIPPKKQVRAVQWGSKKRRLLEAEGTIQLKKERQHDTGSASDEDEDDEDDYDDEDSGILDQRSDEMKRGKAGGRPGPKGKYKKRDMYGAIDGEGLLALGILVEEFVIQELGRAGYRAERDEAGDGVDEELRGGMGYDHGVGSGEDIRDEDGRYDEDEVATLASD